MKHKTGPSLLTRIIAVLIPSLASGAIITWLLITQQWIRFGVWAERSVTNSSTSFADLANSTMIADCLNDGSDISVCDPYGRPFQPYTVPPARIFALFGLGLEETGPIGIALATIFILTVAGLAVLLAYRWQRSGATLLAASSLIAIAACAPPALLGVERGQIELVLLTFAVTGLLLLTRKSFAARGAGAFLTVIAVAMKYFAVGIFMPFIGRNRWNKFAFAAMALSGLFLILSWNDVQLARETARSEIASTTRIMFSSTSMFVTWIVDDPLAFNPQPGEIEMAPLRWLALALFLGLTISSILIIRRSKVNVGQIDPSAWVLMIGGVGILLVPYFLGESNDYRLIMLLMVITGTMLWWNQQGHSRLPWLVALAATFSCVTGAAMIPTDSGFTIPEPILLLGDFSLMSTLAFGTALVITSWLPEKTTRVDLESTAVHNE